MNKKSEKFLSYVFAFTVMFLCITFFKASVSFAAEYKDIVTVGLNKDAETVSGALALIYDMQDRNARKVTVKIDSGVYREGQLIIREPNIKLENAENPSYTVLGNDEADVKKSKNVVITGYYGYGCVYKSTNEKDPEKWGATVYIPNSAKNFSAEGITFENSYNLYVTNEEKSDYAGETLKDEYKLKNNGYDMRISLEAGSEAVRNEALTGEAAAVVI